jgi:hypothetical protein
MERLYVASSARPLSSPVDLRSAEPAEFRGPDGVGLRVSDPLTKAALVELAESWPVPVAFPQLAAQAAARARLTLDAPARRGLALRLLSSHASSPSIELRLAPPTFQTGIDSEPEALPLARWQARGDPRVVNGRHENIILGNAERALLQRLDGTMSIEDLGSQCDDLLGTLARLGAAALLKARTSG